MPTLLLRQNSATPLSTIVEKSQQTPISSPLEYDLQLRNSQLDLILLSPVDFRKHSPPTNDEGFESDIDTISLISSENESFSTEKNPRNPSIMVLQETDSANGGSGTESDTENEKSNTLTQKNVNSIKESFEKQLSHEAPPPKTKECHSLLDCICYTDVKCQDILIFVIKNEAFVFKFDDLSHLKTFYTNFSTLKAVANQKAYNLGKNFGTKYNLLQRIDNNGVTHIEITREQSNKHLYSQSDSGPSSIISIDTVDNFGKSGDHKSRQKDVNLRQRAESKLLNDVVKFNTINSKLGAKKSIIRSSSIENILNLDNNLVNEDVNSLRKVWNSAEDLLVSEIPRRPERRKKKKPAPLPPQKPPEDVFSGQFVRVNVKDHDKNRLIVKSHLNEPHPKKLQSFNILSTKSNLSSFLKPSKSAQILRYPEHTRKTSEIDPNSTLTRNSNGFIYEKNNSWTNSVPRLLKKSSRSKSETRNNNFQPMAYRYIDTTTDHPYNHGQNTALFLNTTGLRPSQQNAETVFSPTSKNSESTRLNLAYNLNRPLKNENNIGNRLFGLSGKLKEFGGHSGERVSNKWGSVSEINVFGGEKNNLKSVIKSGHEGGKKKIDKKVTFSAYTTVQVV